MSNIAISVEPSASDPLAARFVVSHKLADGGPYLFESPEVALGHPLVEALFAVGGVDSLALTENYLSVRLARGTHLGDVARRLGEALRQAIGAGAPVVSRAGPARVDAAHDGELARRVQEVLDRQVNPGVAGHGGAVSLLKVESGIAYVQMSGGCQGCGAAQVTVRGGIEVMVKKAIPEIRRVVDVTDHSKGHNPYFRSLTDLGPSPIVR